MTRVTKIDHSDPFKPTMIGTDWNSWRGPANGDGVNGEEEHDIRSLAMDYLHASRISFKSGISEVGGSLACENRIAQLNSKACILLGGGPFQAYRADLQLKGESSVVCALFKFHKLNFMGFPGMMLRSPEGKRYFLFLRRTPNSWYWGCQSTESELGPDCMFAVQVIEGFAPISWHG